MNTQLKKAILIFQESLANKDKRKTLNQIDYFNYLLSKELFDISLNINNRIDEFKELLNFLKDYPYKNSKEVIVAILLHKDNLHIKNKKIIEKLLSSSKYKIYDSSKFKGKNIEELKSLFNEHLEQDMKHSKNCELANVGSFTNNLDIAEYVLDNIKDTSGLLFQKILNNIELIKIKNNCNLTDSFRYISCPYLKYQVLCEIAKINLDEAIKISEQLKEILPEGYLYGIKAFHYSKKLNKKSIDNLILENELLLEEKYISEDEFDQNLLRIIESIHYEYSFLLKK